MNQEQYYLYHKYLGNYHYLLNDHEAALKTYLMAEKIAPPTIPASEMGDLYYSIGISSAQCWETEMSFKYSEMALKIYQQEFIPKRIVECHSNIALTQFQFGNFKAAIEHYRNAYTIGSKLDNDILRFTTEFNLGYTYFLRQNYEESIYHIESSLKFIPPEYASDSLMSYIVMIKCFIELNNLKEAQVWIDKGLEIIEVKKINMDSPTNLAFKEAYIEFMSLIFLINNEYTEFEDLVTSKLMPSLELNNNFFEMGYFYNHLGIVCSKQKRFAESVKYMNKARQAYQDLLVNKTRSDI